jgi:hypothetical protein
MTATIVRLGNASVPAAGTPAGGVALDHFRRDLLATLGDARLLWLPKASDTTTNTDDTRNARVITYDATIAGDINPLGSGVVWDLDGTVEEADTPNVTALSFGDGAVDQAFSVMALFNSDTPATGSTLVSKWDTNNSSGEKREWIFGNLTGSGFPIFALYDDVANDQIGRYYATVNAADTWIFTVATYDGSASLTGIRLYKDGVRVDDTDVGAGGYIATKNLDTPVNIGANLDTGGTSPTNFFNGELGLVAITGKELNIDDIWQIKTLINGFFDLSL